MSFGPPKTGFVTQCPTNFDRFTVAAKYVDALHENYANLGEQSIPSKPVYNWVRNIDNQIASSYISAEKRDVMNAAFVDYIIVNGVRCARMDFDKLK